MRLTAAEKQALNAAFNSAAGNGHDFGFIEDIVEALRPMKAQAVGALVTSLIKKGVFDVHSPVVTNNGGPGNVWTQFTWNIETETVKAMTA